MSMLLLLFAQNDLDDANELMMHLREKGHTTEAFVAIASDQSAHFENLPTLASATLVLVSSNSEEFRGAVKQTLSDIARYNPSLPVVNVLLSNDASPISDGESVHIRGFTEGEINGLLEVLPLRGPAPVEPASKQKRANNRRKRRTPDHAPTVIIAWHPDVLSPEEYAQLVTALGDVARENGAIGIERLNEQAVGWPTPVGVVK